MPTAIKQSPITKTVFDLVSFDEVTLVKAVPDFVPAENTSEVLARVGNDSTVMLELLNAGLKERERDSVSTNSDPWHTYTLDADGEPTGEINGPFTGTPADMSAVNALQLTLAKTVFGYNKGMTKDEKRAAKNSALDMIKANDAIKAGLQKSAAPKVAPVAETPAAA